MVSYNTSDFRKGLKVQLEGDPFIMIECQFVKPGKGQALYKCKLRNLLRGTVLERTWKSGDSIESADIAEIQAQYLYRNGDAYVFMCTETYEQYELSSELVDENWKYLKESLSSRPLKWPGSIFQHFVRIQRSNPSAAAGCVSLRSKEHATSPARVLLS